VPIIGVADWFRGKKSKYTGALWPMYHYNVTLPLLLPLAPLPYRFYHVSRTAEYQQVVVVK